jgi:hypothetical protein
MAKKDVARAALSNTEIRRLMLQYFYERNNTATSVPTKLCRNLDEAAIFIHFPLCCDRLLYHSCSSPRSTNGTLPRL